MQRHEADLRAGADLHEDQRQRGEFGQWLREANGLESVIAIAAGEQAERQQQRQRAEARHQQIDESGTEIFAQFMIRDHQRPGGQRHKLPRHREREDTGRRARQFAPVDAKQRLGPTGFACLL